VNEFLFNSFKKLAFKLDPETAHNISCSALSSLNFFSPQLLEKILGADQRSEARYTPEFLGMSFPNAVGLAAGFDKNADFVEVLPKLGFGFCEVGTVTPRPQDGNSKPRMQRLVPEKSLFNRMGFNNQGADIISRRLRQKKITMPDNFKIGVNIGKNKDSPEDLAHADYLEVSKFFKDTADFIVVNVSSPNTPGLRKLQTKDHLKKILSPLRDEILAWNRRVPLLFKIAPELQEKELEPLVSLHTDGLCDGIVLTNTLAGDSELGTGGLSGQILQPRAMESLLLLKKLSPKIPCISVGGVATLEEAQKRIDAGAALVEIYTSWIYEGPKLVSQLSADLVERRASL